MSNKTNKMNKFYFDKIKRGKLKGKFKKIKSGGECGDPAGLENGMSKKAGNPTGIYIVINGINIAKTCMLKKIRTFQFNYI